MSLNFDQFFYRLQVFDLCAALKRPKRISIIVVLPEPDSPTIPTHSLAFKFIEASLIIPFFVFGYL